MLSSHAEMNVAVWEYASSSHLYTRTRGYATDMQSSFTPSLRSLQRVCHTLAPALRAQRSTGEKLLAPHAAWMLRRQVLLSDHKEVFEQRRGGGGVFREGKEEQTSVPEVVKTWFSGNKGAIRTKPTCRGLWVPNISLSQPPANCQHPAVSGHSHTPPLDTTQGWFNLREQ